MISKYNEKVVAFYCLSTDEKPTDDVATGCLLCEMDTKTLYIFDGEQGMWVGYGKSGGQPTLFPPVILGGYNQISWSTNTKNGDFTTSTTAFIDETELSGNTLNITVEHDNKNLQVITSAENFKDGVVDVLLHHMTAQSSLLSVSNGAKSSSYGLCVELSDTSSLVPQGYESTVDNKYFSYKINTDATGTGSGSLSFSVACLSSARPDVFKVSVVNGGNSPARGTLSLTIMKNGVEVGNILSDEPEISIPDSITWTQYDDIEFIINAALISFDPVMANNDWLNIFNAFRTGDAPDTWLVGDTKSLTLTDGNTYTIRLCDKQLGRYAYSDGSGSSKCVFEFVELVKVGSTGWFQMNTSDTNADGWASCYMRGTNIPNIEALLQDDILGAISEVNVLSGTGSGTSSGTSSSVNKLFLPAEMELFSSQTYSIGNAECLLGQFDYYRTHNTNADRTKKIIGTTNAYYYWLRSPCTGSSSNFCLVHLDGSEMPFSAGVKMGSPAYFAI